MKEFKNIKAVFNAKARNGERVKIKIERLRSKAAKYGDESAHEVQINSNESEFYDTRYDGIPTDEKKWVNFWADLLKDWHFKRVKLVSLDTNIVQD